MADFKDYKMYVSDENWSKVYSHYQEKYAINPRESDKVSAQLVKRAIQEMQPLGRKPVILDIGCSTGNFLLHLSDIIPDATLIGADLMASVIDTCKNNSKLKDIQFEVMDVFDIPNEKPFDIIVANAVNVYFEPDEYDRALKSISNALTKNGVFIAFEWVFEGDREQRNIEKSEAHPEGLKFWFRSSEKVRKSAELANFSNCEITTFDIPIDLPKPEITGTDADLITYTVKDEETGKRRMFRGSLYQPWAHIYAKK